MVKPTKIFRAALAATAGAAMTVSAFSPTLYQQTSLARPQQQQQQPQVALHATLSSSSAPSILDRPNTLPTFPTIETSPSHQTDTHQQSPNSDDWILRIYNDNINTREYVAVCLVQVVGLCESRAYFTMQDAHDNGIAKVGEYNQEVAECYEEQLVERGIMCDVVACE